MRQPQTIWSLCAFIFGLMGIIFVFLGMLFYITDIPVNGGCNWFFIPIGAILLLGSVVCLARCGLQEQRRKHLKTNGISVVGKIQSVRHLVWINWNTKTFVNWPGQCSPWVVQCSYCYGGRTYTVKSLLSWIKPATDFQQPVIYLDPRNPVHAYSVTRGGSSRPSGAWGRAGPPPHTPGCSCPHHGRSPAAPTSSAVPCPPAGQKAPWPG